jgi:hypothetical protein
MRFCGFSYSVLFFKAVFHSRQFLEDSMDMLVGIDATHDEVENSERFVDEVKS